MGYILETERKFVGDNGVYKRGKKCIERGRVCRLVDWFSRLVVCVCVCVDAVKRKYFVTLSDS